MTAQNHSQQTPGDWISRWQRFARRIRVPLGFGAAALYVFELWNHPPAAAAIAWSLVLVMPGLWLRGYASGYVKKNQELTTTGPYAHVRNPLYLGSILIAAGFAVALESWIVGLALAILFVAIYVPVIASEERFLRATFPGFEDYCQRVPRLIPRLTASRSPGDDRQGRFFLPLYLKHREYNALLGAVLLYLCLLILRPALNILFHGRL
jgi:protein-S-isoprenylcysteine O-methyltransferase Ste14